MNNYGVCYLCISMYTSRKWNVCEQKFEKFVIERRKKETETNQIKNRNEGTIKFVRDNSEKCK